MFEDRSVQNSLNFVGVVVTEVNGVAVTGVEVILPLAKWGLAIDLEI